MSATDVTSTALGVAIGAGVPVLLWGAPGTGKTSVIREIARGMRARHGDDEESFPLETVIASVYEPADIAGLPIVAEDRVVLSPPAWARRLSTAGRGLLFFDEISTAPPAVQAALLRVCLERVVGELPLPTDVVIAAAANPPAQAAAGWDLSAPLANRFCHLDWMPDPSAIADGLTGGFVAPVVPDFGLTSFSDARARGMVTAFLRARPELTVAVPSEESAAGRGWPSPRSWEQCIRLLAACEAIGAARDVQLELVVGSVGEGAGTEFCVFAEELDLPDPEAVLASPGTFDLPTRGDRIHAVLGAVVAAATGRPTPARWDAAWAVLARAASAGFPDVAAVAARTLAVNRPPNAIAPRSAQAFAPLLTAAGIGL